MRRQQSGFTLIELVVVIVLLGILAAAAVPRFIDLTNEARAAVAEGVVGAVLSSAVILYGQNTGQPSTFEEIVVNIDLSGEAAGAQYAEGVSTTFGDFGAASTLDCPEDGDAPFVFSVRVGDTAANAGYATGTIPEGLCIE